VDVIRGADDGSTKVLARLEPGAFFGEEGLARRAPRNAHVIAAENVTCQVFSPGAPTAFVGRGEKAHLGRLAVSRENEGQTARATTSIGVGPYLPQKMGATVAHRSKHAIEADVLPLPILRELMGWESFVRANPASEIELRADPAPKSKPSFCSPFPPLPSSHKVYIIEVNWVWHLEMLICVSFTVRTEYLRRAF
jgi:hypothetical protein